MKSKNKKMEKLNKRIENNPNDAEAYFERAEYFLSLKKYDEAITDHKRVIKINPKNSLSYETLVKLCIKQKKIGDLLEILGLDDSISIENFKDLDEARIIELIIKKYLDLGQYKNASYFFWMTIGKIENDRSYDESKIVLDNLDTSLISRLAQKLAYKKKYGEAKKIINQLFELPYKDSELREDLRDETAKIERIKNQIEMFNDRVEERNKIIADLSHSIKNMLGTVIDPLENLKNEKEIKPKIINSAIRGANIVGQIVNAINLSYKGSYKDFVYDAKNNEGKDSTSLKKMIVDSLKHSISNMFDSKYFGNFMRNYFPTKEIFLQAKSAWSKISTSDEIKEIKEFAEKYFFETNFNLDSAHKYVIGNQKGSAIKLQILFQEIILNAVKFAGFVQSESRKLIIHFSKSGNKLSLFVENSFKPGEKTRTTGLGHIVIENFAKLLRTKPVINRSDDIFSLQIKFHKFWENKVKSENYNKKSQNIIEKHKTEPKDETGDFGSETYTEKLQNIYNLKFKEKIEKIRGKLKNEVFEVENRDDISNEEKVNKIIKIFSATCAAIAVQPIPFADIFVLTPIQGYMGARIASIYNIKMQEEKITEIIKEIAGVVGLGILSQQLAIGAYKTFIPFLGAFTTIPLVYSLTYGIGKVMDVYFEKRAKGERISNKSIKEIFKKNKKIGKKLGKQNKKNIKEKAD